jgi:predicted membrane protein
METIKKFDNKLIIGLILMLLGAVLLFDNYFNLGLRHVVLSWPMILIVIGVVSMSNTNVLTPGLVLVTIGVIFLLPRFDFWPYTISFRELFWPMILIGVGVIMITNRGKIKKHKGDFGFHGEKKLEEGFIEDTNIFGGGNKVITSKQFRGGNITSIFGGSEYNFVAADIVDGKAEIEITYIFGGSKFIVPSDWKVVTDVSAIFGGFSDKRIGSSVDQNTDKILYIKGSVIFGGGEIVSY